MAGCVLRVKKEGLMPETWLSIGIFPDATQFKDGFNFTVSDSDEFQEQLKDSEAFLRNNEKECKKLIGLLKPEAPVLDYGVWRSEGFSQSVVFPSSLVSIAGGLGFELSASFYEASDL